MESFCEAIVLKISLNTEQCQSLPSPPTGFVRDKGVLGRKIANAIYIHQEALHLPLLLVMMVILLLMQSHKKLMVN